MPKTRHDPMPSEQAQLLGHDERTPAHSHGRGHLVYPASGMLSVATSAGSWIAPPNRVVWIPAHSEHRHRSHGISDVRIVFLAPQLAALLPAHPAVLVMTPLARAATLALTSGDERPAAARSRLRRVVIDDLVAAPEQPLHLPEPSDDRLRAVTHLVEQQLSRPASLADLGRRVGAGERTLSRLFHEETGMSFPQWRTQLRIHRALRMLADGTPVLATATACGWSNPSAFIDTFTALVGQTPGRYQRSLSPA
ncbi:helix-turn-helix transcriptional regulator [Actinoplanes sp. TBRC 11911]|uniref:AraC family transcriptional regulator n=1 Tax=Actinoplanes sp. TBRC 11911 TaxID=2729386 RepID=UPI00145EF3E8|nr:helix-turn-helix transcriptional regulator [Actinoplanes sp. TBRC 11911]NMO55693.1 helix-turn-helix transcriptional regulator [Actinoplanes sp. TBRC 11911]